MKFSKWLSAQRTNESQIQRFLNWRQLWHDFCAARAEFRSLILQVRIRKLSHQDEHQLRLFWRGDGAGDLRLR